MSAERTPEQLHEAVDAQRDLTSALPATITVARVATPRSRSGGRGYWPGSLRRTRSESERVLRRLPGTRAGDDHGPRSRHEPGGWRLAPARPVAARPTDAVGGWPTDALNTLATPPAAVAATPGVDVCAAKSQESIVVNYRRGALVMPLRCGSSTWGFRHVVGRLRWNERFDASIALAFSRGQEFHNGSTYALFDSDCRERFRVKVDPRAFRGVEFRPQGIVTAYETNWPYSVSWTDGRTGASYRTDCKPFDRIRLQA